MSVTYKSPKGVLVCLGDPLLIALRETTILGGGPLKNDTPTWVGLKIEASVPFCCRLKIGQKSDTTS